MKPKASILVTTYNFEKYIGRAIESLLNQQCSFDYEVIVVDDCSKDRTHEVMAKFNDSRLTYIRNKVNVGASEAANIAFQHAQGEYISRMDGDDVWYPFFLEETARVLDERPEVGLVYGDIHTIDQDDNIDEKASIDRPPLPMQSNELVPLLHRHYICAPTMLARRELWEAVLPYPEELKTGLADWYLTLKMAQKAEFCYIPKAVAMYRIHTSSMHHAFIHNKSGERAMKFILDYFLIKNDDGSVGRQERNKIYGRHYRSYGSGYFGNGMTDDARRCYTQALRYDKSHLFDRKFIFPFIGSLMGSSLYNRLKLLFSNPQKLILGKTN